MADQDRRRRRHRGTRCEHRCELRYRLRGRDDARGRGDRPRRHRRRTGGDQLRLDDLLRPRRRARRDPARTRVFDHIQALSLKYHSRASIGDTSRRLVGDIGRLQEVAVTAGLPLLGNIITLAVLLVVMVVLDPVLSAIVLATAVVYGVLSRVSTPKITTASRSTRKGRAASSGPPPRRSGRSASSRPTDSNAPSPPTSPTVTNGPCGPGVRARRLAAGLERSTDVLVGISQALVLAFGGYQVLRGAMTPGDLVLFLLYLKIAMKPPRDMAKYTGRIARATASGERIADLLDEPIEIADRPGAVAMGSVRGDVVFDGIRSRDGHGRPLFDGLDLLIPAGQRIGILGASGAGKSTLTSYLLRLAQPEKGRIYLDGYDTGNVTRASLRGGVSVLLQESVLFAATVRENIRYGRLDATDAEVEAAARAARADEFIRALPEGYDTVLGNRGDTLSGGQRRVWRSPGPSSAPPRSSSSTRRAPGSTRAPERRSPSPCGRSPRAAPGSSSPTTSPWSEALTGSCGLRTGGSSKTALPRISRPTRRAALPSG